MSGESSTSAGQTTGSDAGSAGVQQQAAGQAGEAGQAAGAQQAPEGAGQAQAGSVLSAAAGQAGGEPGKYGAGAEGSKGAPEAYEAFKLPEGFTPTPELDTFGTLAKEFNLSQENAQKLVDLYSEARKKESDGFNATVEEWKKACATDKEFGGAKYEENMAAVGKLMRQYGSPEALAMLDSGVGSHPAIVRMMFKIAMAMKEDSHGGGDVGGGGKPNALDRLYDKSNMAN